MEPVVTILFLSIFPFLGISEGKDVHSHSVPTYFHRLDPKGKPIDRNNEVFTRVFEKDFNEGILSSDRKTGVLKVKPFLINNADEVEVSWSGILKPSARDFVALYCPRNGGSRKMLDYFFVTDAKDSWHKGYGKRKVTLFNMRSSCEFRYFRSEDEVTQRVAVSNPVGFLRGPMEPLQGHLALTGNPTEMRVMWTSTGIERPFVVYGKTKQSINQVVVGTSKTYMASDMCGPPANTTGFIDPGYIHDVLVKDLKPNSLYFYSYGTEEHMSPIYNFTTAIPAGDKTPYKFVVYGDMGVEPFPQAQETGKRMLEEYNSNHIRFVLHDGDISYARGYGYIWDQWHAIIEPYAVLMPYMVTIGNHEQDHETGGEKDPSGAPGIGFHPMWGGYDGDSHGECGVPMYHRFHMPDNGNALWWYSFDYGLVHFVQISTEHDYSPGTRQYSWLENDLKKVNRELTPWVIISGHRAMYCSQKIEGDWIVSLNMQRLFEDLLYKYQVDLAFWAHYHSYERTCKVYRNVCQEGGMVHIVVGTAGKSKDTEGYYGMNWSLKQVQDYGYGRVSVLNETALHFEWLRNSDRVLLDDVFVTK